jgi:hypothetical protein
MKRTVTLFGIRFDISFPNDGVLSDNIRLSVHEFPDCSGPGGFWKSMSTDYIEELELLGQFFLDAAKTIEEESRRFEVASTLDKLVSEFGAEAVLKQFEILKAAKGQEG